MGRRPGVGVGWTICWARTQEDVPARLSHDCEAAGLRHNISLRAGGPANMRTSFIATPSSNVDRQTKGGGKEQSRLIFEKKIAHTLMFF